METDFYSRLRAIYDGFKKEISVLILILAVLVDVLPDGLIPSEAEQEIQIALIFGLSLIMIGVLFEILNMLQENSNRVTTLEFTDLSTEIYRLIQNEREINIQYVAVAGISGWPILANFLDENDAKSQLHKKKVNIEIAVIDESVLGMVEKSHARYSGVTNTVSEINKIKDRIARKGYNNVNIEVYQYNYMPNFVGFLVNDNYLFSTLCYWEIEDGTEDELVLRGGRRNYIVYDKNDGFGGEFYIARFKGWLNFIKQKYPNTDNQNAYQTESQQEVIS
ncbi:hypothetical protein [Bacterioplanoides sp.]|uniref:hypothetical protein n=1 Tax=Bacterioplanoides sp. TaxID=2066072 RepID=UPI003B5C7ACE